LDENQGEDDNFSLVEKITSLGGGDFSHVIVSKIKGQKIQTPDVPSEL
jgi:hypothetical protein